MQCTCNKHTFNVNAVFKVDPTRTLTLRNDFTKAFKRRFVAIKNLIIKSIVQNDCFGLTLEFATGPFIMNVKVTQFQQFAFERDPKKVQMFMDWLRTQVNDGILEILPGQQLGTAVETAWTNQYIQTAYQKGMLRGRNELNNIGVENLPPYGTQYGSLQSAFNQPFHIDKVGLIYTRTFEGLKGITDEMSKQISGVLAQGIAEGWGPAKLARDITNRVDKIGITRATILARTEVIRAHHVAMIQEYRNWGIAGVKVLVEWQIAGDNRVCPLCQDLSGKIFSLAQIEGMIPRHPQCRCVALPVDKEGVAEVPKVKEESIFELNLKDKADELKKLESLLGTNNGNYIYRSVEKANKSNPTLVIKNSKGEIFAAANYTKVNDSLKVDTIGSLGNGGGTKLIKELSTISLQQGRDGAISLTPLGRADTISFYIKTGFDSHPTKPGMFLLTKEAAKEMEYIQ